ncbi:hypothetical protein ACFLRF_05650, partial [Candidatus Altiarchaeota archaeon]
SRMLVTLNPTPTTKQTYKTLMIEKAHAIKPQNLVKKVRQTYGHQSVQDLMSQERYAQEISRIRFGRDAFTSLAEELDTARDRETASGFKDAVNQTSETSGRLLAGLAKTLAAEDPRLATKVLTSPDVAKRIFLLEKTPHTQAWYARSLAGKRGELAADTKRAAIDGFWADDIQSRRGIEERLGQAQVGPEQRSAYVEGMAGAEDVVRDALITLDPLNVIQKLGNPAYMQGLGGSVRGDTRALLDEGAVYLRVSKEQGIEVLSSRGEA